jgi:hypothetical protein
MTQPAAGWFPDPSDPNRLRYFDGKVWTEQYANVGGPPPFPAQPVEQAKKQWNWKWIAGIGAVFLVLLFIGNLGSDNDKKSTATGGSGSSPSKSYDTQTARAEPSRPSVAPAGSPVRDGKFEFQVLGVERGATSLDDAFGPEVAKGEFFTVKIRVTNVGDDARSFFATNQKLIINGNEYEATSFLDNSRMEDINPGLGIDAQVTFDIPKGAVPTAIEFHDSMFSGGATVAL